MHHYTTDLVFLQSFGYGAERADVGVAVEREAFAGISLLHLSPHDDVLDDTSEMYRVVLLDVGQETAAGTDRLLVGCAARRGVVCHQHGRATLQLTREGRGQNS